MELEIKILTIFFRIILLTRYSNMLGIIVLLEGNVSPSDHAHEVPGGDEGHIGQGQLAG